jgi:hypothetical protein
MNSNKNTNRVTSGSGSARNAAGLMGFGRRLLLMVGEDANNSGGGGGTGAGGESGNPPPNGNGAPAKVTFSPEQQAEINRIAANAREEGRKSAQNGTNRPQPQPQPNNGEGGGKKTMSLEELQAKYEESEARRVFDRHAIKLNLPDAASDKLFKLYRADAPSDATAWFTETVETFGFGKGNVNPNQNAGNGNNGQTEQKQPPTAPNAPNKIETPLTQNGLVDIYRVTPEQFTQLTPQQIKEHHERAVAAGNAQAGAPPLPKVLQRK